MLVDDLDHTEAAEILDGVPESLMSVLIERTTPRNQIEFDSESGQARLLVALPRTCEDIGDTRYPLDVVHRSILRMAQAEPVIRVTTAGAVTLQGKSPLWSLFPARSQKSGR